MSPAPIVVIGAGVAGCVAARTAADAGHDVVVLEAGPGPDRPESLDSLDHLGATAASEWWFADGPRRGRGMGGSSSVNGMVLDAIHPLDIKRWGWDDASEHQRWLLDRWPQAQLEPGPFTRAFGERVECGFPIAGSTVVSGWSGWGTLTLSARDGRRVSAADVFLPADLETAGSVQVRPYSHVRRIGGGPGARVVEVDNGETLAASTVFVAAGSVGSPALLLDSELITAHQVAEPLNHPSTAVIVELAEELQAPAGAAPSSRLLRTVTGLSENTVDLQILVLDHTGADDAGRRHGAVIVSALEPDRQKVLVAGITQVLHWLRMIDGVGAASISGDQTPVQHHTSTLPASLAGSALSDIRVVDASTLPALPHTNPMVSVAIGARRAALAALESLGP